MWYQNHFHAEVEGLGEFFNIERDLLAGTENELFAEISSMLDIRRAYLISRERGSYILDLSLFFLADDLFFVADDNLTLSNRYYKKASIRGSITSTDKKTVEEEIQRARMLIDNVIRVKRLGTKSSALKIK